MIVQRDYILRLIQEAAKVLKQMLMLNETKEYRHTEMALDQFLQTQFGLSLESLKTFKSDYAVDLLMQKTGRIPEANPALARLFDEMGSQAQELAEFDDSVTYDMMAIRFWVDAKTTMDPDDQLRLIGILKRVGLRNVDRILRGQILEQFIRDQNFTAFEDWLFHFLDQHLDPALVAWGIHTLGHLNEMPEVDRQLMLKDLKQRQRMAL